MLAKKAKQIVDDHLQGKVTAASKLIVGDIARSALESKLAPPFQVKAVRIAQLRDEQGYREMFAEYSQEQLIETVIGLLEDAERLRRELDEATGVIR